MKYYKPKFNESDIVKELAGMIWDLTPEVTVRDRIDNILDEMDKWGKTVKQIKEEKAKEKEKNKKWMIEIKEWTGGTPEDALTLSR